MEIKTKIGISNRHVHLTKEDYDLLFDEEINVEHYIHQKGEFASDKFVTIKNGDKKIEHVRVVGPLRKYTQVEISHSDALKLDINPPVRASGDLDGASIITIETEKESISKSACIIAQRHVHMLPIEAEKYGFKDKQKVYLAFKKERGGMMEAYIKVSDNAFMEAHIDTDEANAFSLYNDDEVIIIV